MASMVVVNNLLSAKTQNRSLVKKCLTIQAVWSVSKNAAIDSLRMLNIAYSRISNGARPEQLLGITRNLEMAGSAIEALRQKVDVGEAVRN